MPLSDTEIRAELCADELVIEPCSTPHIQPASVDLHLGPIILVPEMQEIDLGAGRDVADQYARCDMREAPYDKDGFILRSNQFVLGATLQHIALSRRLCGHFTGRSTLGRVGLLVHVTAGFCDPGFAGCVTLEIKNLAPYPIRLRPGIGIGQLLVERVEGYVERPYGSSLLASAYTGANDGPVAPNLARKL